MIHVGDALTVLPALPATSVQTCVTSPPYWGLRDYGVAGQLGLESTPEEYTQKLVAILREVRRVLRNDGTLWLNLGDSYAGSWGSQGRQGATGQMSGRAVVDARIAKRQIAVNRPQKSRAGSLPVGSGLKSKDLVGVPWMVAFALRADGWFLRSDIIWHKLNPMPESVRDRPTRCHEQVFLLSKSEHYHYNADAIREVASINSHGARVPGCGAKATLTGRHRGPLGLVPTDNGRNARTIWPIASKPYRGAHFATFPPDLPRRCILAGSRSGDVVLDPFAGAGTTWLVAQEIGREFVGVELNPKYAALATERERVRDALPLFSKARAP